MAQHGVLFVRDPIISLDIAEILADRLHPIQLRMASSAQEAAGLLKDALCLVTDKIGAREIAAISAAITIPHLYLDPDEELPLSQHFARIDQPFTNASVIDAMMALGLIRQTETP